MNLWRHNWVTGGNWGRSCW